MAYSVKKQVKEKKNVQERRPNFRGKDGELFLVRCFVCDPERGKENWAPGVASGTCAWCGWTEKE